MKTCSACREQKPDSEFHTMKRRGRIELTARCKLCNNKKNREWYFANRELRLEQCRDYSATHRDARTEYMKQWRSNNRDKARASYHNRKAKELAGGSYTGADVDTIKREQFVGGHIRCFYCGCSIDTNYTVEHVTPLSRGGSNTIDNLVLACPHCNYSKGSKTLLEWHGAK